MLIRRPLTATLLAASLALSACGGSSDGDRSGTETSTTEATATSDPGSSGGSGSGTAEVDIADFAYAPGEIEVQAGDTVTFTNSDDAAHTATSKADDPAEFDTGNIDGGDAAEVTLDEAGDYEYYCSIHEYMTGTIRVVG